MREILWETYLGSRHGAFAVQGRERNSRRGFESFFCSEMETRPLTTLLSSEGFPSPLYPATSSKPVSLSELQNVYGVFAPGLFVVLWVDFLPPNQVSSRFSLLEI